MRLVLQCNRRSVAADCFEKSLKQIVRPPRDGITVHEVKYMAQELAAACFNGISESWLFSSGARQLVELKPYHASTAELTQCEWIANNVLILEGVVFRSAAKSSMTYQQAAEMRTRIQYAQTLYRTASLGNFRDLREKAVLGAMSEHSLEWARHLSRLEGNDFQGMLSGKSSQSAILQ